MQKFHRHICYIVGDMIPPNQGSSLSQDSSLNMTPGENCYISGYRGPNVIYQYVIERAQTLRSVVEFLDAKDETMTCVNPYNLPMLNNPETGYLGKMIISPNW